MDSLNIQFPQLNEKNITYCYAQSRPYRKGGYRNELQQFSQKIVFHSYGYGGSGVSLSYGAALQSFNLFQKSLRQQTQKVECAVLGSGIIGLMTSLILVSHGHKVKIYAQRIPQFGEKDNDKMITSQVAPGFWFPYDFLGFQPQVTKRMSQNTFNFLSDIIAKKQIKGIQFVPVYDGLFTEEDYNIVFTQQMRKSYKKIQLNFKNGEKELFNTYQTIRLDLQIFVNEIITLLKSKGVQFIKRKIQDQSQVKQFKENYIFNCLGNGAPYVFGQKQKAEHVTGHLIQIKNPDFKKFNYTFTVKNKEDKLMMFCHETRILIGFTRHDYYNTKVNKEIINQILAKTNAYIRPKSMPPSKL